jgi:mannose-6-phosphate isomerase-like protein (cupin superfamily)
MRRYFDRRMQIVRAAGIGLLSMLAVVPPAHAQTGTAGTGRGTRNAQTARPSMTVQVTDLEGKPLADVWVKASGPVDRELSTDANGFVTFRTMAPGTYRLRFERDDFVTLEREVTHTSRASNVSVALNAAPPKPAAAEPEAPATPPAPTLPPPGPPTFVSIPDFFEKHYIGSAPSLTSEVGCVPAAVTNLLQLREPLAEHVHNDADELLYVVAGEGTHRINGKEIPLAAGVLATVPRGSPHSITRRGRNPIIVLSIITEPCAVK